MKDIIINKEKFKRLANGEKVYFNRKPLQHGNNIFTFQLNELAYRREIEMKDYNYRAKLDESITDVDIFSILFLSNLNEKFALFFLYVETSPKKEKILNVIKQALNDSNECDPKIGRGH